MQHQKPENDEQEEVRWLTPKEAAGRLHVSHYTVIRLCKRRKLPGEKIGHQWRIRENALNKYHSA